jgi:ATP-dependent DNA helicase RecQ
MGQRIEAEPPAAVEEEPPAEGDKYTALQKALWLWRLRRAEAQGQPTYMIMSNELILRIAETRPQTLEELAALPGMGAQRLEHYGPAILDLIHLNPPQEGDQELLAAQRAAPRPHYQTAAPPAEPAISPQVERKIFLKLQEMRQKQAIARGDKPSFIASNTLLKQIAQRAPTTPEALERVPGFKDSGLSRIANEILTFIQSVVQSVRATSS